MSPYPLRPQAPGAVVAAGGAGGANLEGENNACMSYLGTVVGGRRGVENGPAWGGIRSFPAGGGEALFAPGRGKGTSKLQKEPQKCTF